MTAEMPSIEELKAARDVLTRLLEYFGSVHVVSLGKEGYLALDMALDMARDVVDECVQGIWSK